MRIETINGMLHQWDTGRQVQVTCDEGMTLEEVRFSHHRSPSVIRVTPDANGAADIPDELLRDAGQLTVSAVMIDARGKQHVRSECFCTDDAVRPKGYSVGGNGGGSGGSNMVEDVIVNASGVGFGTNQYGYGQANFMIEHEFVLGNTYIVEIDGKSYSCIAKETVVPNANSGGRDLLKCIGNASLIPYSGYEDTGEPFFAYCYPDGVIPPGMLPYGATLIDLWYLDETIITPIKITTQKSVAANSIYVEATFSVDGTYTVFSNTTMAELRDMLVNRTPISGVYIQKRIIEGGGVITVSNAQVGAIYRSDEDNTVLFLSSWDMNINFCSDGTITVG